MNALANEHIKKHYANTNQIYTDGSRDLGLTGLGVYSDELGLQTKLRTTDHAAIATVEMTAILVALEAITESRPVNETVILTDSLSALQALKSHDQRNKRYDLI